MLPLALGFTLFRPSYLLALLIISSVFQGAAVINGKVGDFEFGLPPFYFVAICIAFRYLLLFVNDNQGLLPADNPTRGLSKVLLYFTAWCVSSSFILPRLFAGMEVYDPRGGIDQQYVYQSALTWSFSNLAQAIFLVLDVVVVLYALRVVKTSVQSSRLIRSFLVAAGIVTLIGLSESVAGLLGWSFPYAVLNSNPVYSQGFDQMLDSYQRINATFTEPSYAGAFLASAASGLLASYLGGKKGLGQFLLMSGVLIVLLSTTSTTGYAAFGITTALLLFFFNPLAKRTEHRRSSAKGWSAIFAAALVCGMVLHFNEGLFEAAVSATLDKVDGLSFVHRIASDSFALSLARNTYGLGTGLGSNRPSSLLTALLSTVGVPGTLLFGMIVYRCFKGSPGYSSRNSFQIAVWALCGLLIAQVIGIPDITSSVLWAVLLMTAAQMRGLASPKPSDSANSGARQFAH